MVVATPFVAFLFSTTFGGLLRVGHYLDTRNLTLFGIVLMTGAAIDTSARRTINLAGGGGLSWKEFGSFRSFLFMVEYGWYLPLALIAYALFEFPLIPAAFGGGALQSAEVFVKPEGQQLLNASS